VKTLIAAITISIGFVVTGIGGNTNIGIIDAGKNGSTNQPADIGTAMPLRGYKIPFDTFFISLKKKIAPKDGESDKELLVRYFKEQHIDFYSHPGFAMFLNDRKGMLYVRATPTEHDKIEHLISDIINSK
jgi:hypothetical protein